MQPLSLGSESSILKLSAAGAGFFALLGIGWGLWSNSMAILFDGSYSLISLGLSVLSLVALRVASAPASNRFNFGRMFAEPLSIAVKGLVILLLCVFSLVMAIFALLNGGRDIELGKAILFTLLNVGVCFGIWAKLKQANSEHRSALVDAETKQWWMDAVLSVAVTFGFLATWGLQHTAFAGWAAYADPVLVILVSGYFMQVPFKMLMGAVGELMLVSPPAKLREQVYQALKVVDIDAKQCKIAKCGSHIIIEVRMGVSQVEQMQN